jgi:hypothetical protein
VTAMEETRRGLVMYRRTDMDAAVEVTE